MRQGRPLSFSLHSLHEIAKLRLGGAAPVVCPNQVMAVAQMGSGESRLAIAQLDGCENSLEISNHYFARGRISGSQSLWRERHRLSVYGLQRLIGTSSST